MNRFPLNHVGILMTSMERALAFCEKFGLKPEYHGYVEIYQADCILMEHRESETPIELIIPREGILTQYNNGKGGIHHIAFEVDDIETVRLEYEEKGLYMLEDHAVQGNQDTLVNYLRPRFGEGILIEFVEPKRTTE